MLQRLTKLWFGAAAAAADGDGNAPDSPGAAAARAASSGVDVDYIVPQLAVCSPPWRHRTVPGHTNVGDLAAWAEQRHAGRAMVFNLEPYDANQYDYGHFAWQVVEYDLGRVVDLDTLLQLCVALDAWLKLDAANVALVHCHTGRARLALAVTAYLVYSGASDSPAGQFCTCIHLRTYLLIQRRWSCFANGGAGSRPTRSCCLSRTRAVCSTLPTC